MRLFLVTDALRRTSCYKAVLQLLMPYLPYARQDRVCNPGEALSVRVFADLINTQRYESVTVWDAHSEVGVACLDRCINVHCADFVARIVSDPERTVLVAPDAGSLKKVGECAKRLNMDMVRADKTRDVQTGAITGTTVYSEHVGDKNFLIVDDICDGGKTFIALAKELRPLTNGRVQLYVTHGIFSGGLDVFHHMIDDIYVANPFPNVRTPDARQPSSVLHIDVATEQMRWIKESV